VVVCDYCCLFVVVVVVGGLVDYWCYFEWDDVVVFYWDGDFVCYVVWLDVVCVAVCWYWFDCCVFWCCLLYGL